MQWTFGLSGSLLLSCFFGWIWLKNKYTEVAFIPAEFLQIYYWKVRSLTFLIVANSNMIMFRREKNNSLRRRNLTSDTFIKSFTFTFNIQLQPLSTFLWHCPCIILTKGVGSVALLSLHYQSSSGMRKRQLIKVNIENYDNASFKSK